MRPHDIVVSRTAEIPGVKNEEGIVTHIGFGGPTVKVELERNDKSHINVDLAISAFRPLNLQLGEKVWFASHFLRDYPVEAPTEALEKELA